MEDYLFDTRGTCSRQIQFSLDGDKVHNVKFFGGCDGNLKAIPILVEGMTVDEINEKLAGIKCGFKKTSCADQLALAVKTAYEHQQNPDTPNFKPVEDR